MATVAVFLALAGGAAAVSAIGSKQIANNSVRSGDLRNNSARGKDVRDGALTGSDIGDGSIGANDLAAEVISPPVAAADPRLTVRVGSPGTAGANGSGAGCVDGVPAGSNGYQDAAGALVAGGCGGGAGGASGATAECGFGEVATGGGYSYADGKRHALVVESRPVPAGPTPTGWQIGIETLTNDPSNSTPVTPYVVCMRP
jgi:hypothetical protein